MKRPIEKDFVDKYGAVGQPQWTFSNQKYQDALNEYIDLIEKKVKNNGVLDNVTQWVAVKDKMPKEGERVLIYDGEYVCVGVWHGNMWANDDTWLYANDVPKKWKPLPKPPCG